MKKRTNNEIRKSSNPLNELFFDDTGFWNILDYHPFFTDKKNIPSANIKEEDNKYNIDLAIPGMNKDDIDIEVEGDKLIVSAQNKNEDEYTDDNDGYSKKEFSYSSFERSFSLPEDTKEDEIDAEYNNGVLSINIPKNENSREPEKKKVDIK